jgi:hypothetical protein
MPLPGFGSYVAFALELWTLRNLLWLGAFLESRFP